MTLPPIEAPRIELLAPTQVVGMRLRMSLREGRIPELWRAFMPRREEVEGRLRSGYLSMKVYEGGAEETIGPETAFHGWAGVEVAEGTPVPEGMEAYRIASGLYAVFLHRGLASTAPRTWGHIFGVWLPSNPYLLDDRPHFERIPEGYRPEDPEAQEEVWIPIRPL